MSYIRNTVRQPIESVYIYRGHLRSLQPWLGKTVQTIQGPYLESIAKHQFIFHQIKEQKQRKWKIELIYGHEIIPTLQKIKLSFTIHSSLLVIPAGESSELDAAFSDEEASSIKESVGEGLRILGTCGSAYYLSLEREWNDKCSIQPKDTTSLRKTSKMGIYQGRAIGPLSPYPGQIYNSAFFHEAIKIIGKQNEATVLVSGGGTFVPIDSSLTTLMKQRVEVLAKYDLKELPRFSKDATWSPAVVLCDYGKGAAVLSKIHPAYGPEDIDLDSYRKAFPNRKDDWEGIRNSLSPLSKRVSLFYEFIEALETIQSH